MYNIMAVYIAAAYRLSPIDPVTVQVKKNLEKDIVDKFCNSNVRDIKMIRASNELKDQHTAQIKERINNYKNPDKYNSDDIKEYIRHNKEKLVGQVKGHIFRGALTDPIIILTVLVIVSVIVWTIICWVKKCNNVLKWSLTFGCWILMYITGFTIVQLTRLQKNIESIIDREIEIVDKTTMTLLKKKCPLKV